MPASNLAEGWHNGFSSFVGCAHPTIWKFLDVLKLEQALTDLEITRHLTREPVEPCQPKWIRFDQRLSAVIESYNLYDECFY